MVSSTIKFCSFGSHESVCKPDPREPDLGQVNISINIIEIISNISIIIFHLSSFIVMQYSDTGCFFSLVPP